MTSWHHMSLNVIVFFTLVQICRKIFSNYNRLISRIRSDLTEHNFHRIWITVRKLLVKWMSVGAYERICDALIFKASQVLFVCSKHYYDVIMGVMASQITSLTIVYSTVYSSHPLWHHNTWVTKELHWVYILPAKALCYLPDFICERDIHKHGSTKTDAIWGVQSWRHAMETLSVLLVLGERNPPDVHKGAVTRSFNMIF